MSSSTTTVNAAGVGQFNRLLLLFLSDLRTSLPTCEPLAQAEVSLAALINIDPENTAVLEKFMDALRDASDILNSRNPEVLQQLVNSSNSWMSKEELIGLYKQLDQDDRAHCWRYIRKLYSLGKSALPEQDFLTLDQGSPVHALIQSAPEMLKHGGGENLIATTLKTSALGLLDSLATLPLMQEEMRTKRALVDSLELDDGKLMELYSGYYTPAMSQELLMNTEDALLTHGFPLVEGGGEAAAVILQSHSDVPMLKATCMQLSVAALVLATVNPSVIAGLEDMMKEFYEKMQSGEINLDMSDPMAMIQSLGDSASLDQLVALMNT